MSDWASKKMQDEPPFQRTLQLRQERGQPFEQALRAYRAGDLSRAADLFEDAQHYAEAASCWLDCAQFERVLRAAERVPVNHGMFKASANAAFRAAIALHRSVDYLDELARSLDCNQDETANLELVRSVLEYQEMRAESRVMAARRAHGEGPAQHFSRKVETVRGARDNRSGDVFASRYRLGRMLGSGASAEVYLAHDTVLDADVALKLIAGPLAQDAYARVLREIQLTRKLTHENIVRFHDLVVSGATYGLSMELVDGDSLAVLIEQGVLSMEAARRCLLQAGRALSFAHERGVIHRDVKPENMLVGRDGVLKISDFGIAKFTDGLSITRAGMLLGTPYYMAPEQIQDFCQVDHRADVYALGVVAYQLFTGKLPFHGGTVISVLAKHMTVEPIAPIALNPSIPEELDALIRAMLAKDPAQRIDNCDLVARALLAIELGG